MADLQCRRCSASLTHLYRANFWDCHGDQYEEVKCRSCGEVIASRPVFSPRRKIAAEAVSGSREYAYQGRRGGLSRKARHGKTCDFPGCFEIYDSKRSRLGLCLTHGQPVNNWVSRVKSGRKLKAPHILKINGVWTYRDNPIPAIGG